MTKHWLIADQHFDHNNIIELEKRPFANKEEMEEGLIAAWNNVVQKDHIVYILGDFSFKGVQSWERLLRQLNGEKILIQGNHDKSKVIYQMLEAGLLNQVYSVGLYEKIGDRRIYFTHYPMEIGVRKNIYNVHGHIHSETSRYMNQINVGIDSFFMRYYYLKKSVPFGTPVPLDYVLDEMNKLEYEVDDLKALGNTIGEKLNVHVDVPFVIKGSNDLLAFALNKTVESIASRGEREFINFASENID